LGEEAKIFLYGSWKKVKSRYLFGAKLKMAKTSNF